MDLSEMRLSLIFFFVFHPNVILLIFCVERHRDNLSVQGLHSLYGSEYILSVGVDYDIAINKSALLRFCLERRKACRSYNELERIRPVMAGVQLESIHVSFKLWHTRAESNDTFRQQFGSHWQTVPVAG
jgi:hypothetical protein